MYVNLNMDCLRSFVAAVELGGFSRAAGQVARTAPAISLQMDRLEAQVGIQLFKREGRKKALTGVGQEFYAYAKTILVQNDAALRLASSNEVTGHVRLGIVQDLAEDVLPQALSAFSERFQGIRIEVLVERSSVLIDLLERGDLDQVVAFQRTTNLRSIKLVSSKMIWLNKPGFELDFLKPIPVVLVDGPCLFRHAALQALAKVGMSWEIKLTSPSLACVVAAAEAGLGVMVRTPELRERKCRTLTRNSTLPALNGIELHLYTGQESSNLAVRELSTYWINSRDLGG